MQTEDINWEFIADTIERQKTILFLGHGASIFQKFDSLRRADYYRR